MDKVLWTIHLFMDKINKFMVITVMYISIYETLYCYSFWDVRDEFIYGLNYFITVYICYIIILCICLFSFDKIVVDCVQDDKKDNDSYNDANDGSWWIIGNSDFRPYGFGGLCIR